MLRIVLVFAILLAVAPAFADHCADDKCPSWDTAWTGEFVNIQWAAQRGGKDQYGTGWFVPGVWLRIDNHRSVPVRVCFSFKVYTVDETLTTWDHKTGVWTDNIHTRTQVFHWDPDARCLTAAAGKVSDDQILTADTRADTQATDISVEVLDADVQYKSSTPAGPTMKSLVNLGLLFARAQGMVHKTSPDAARAKQACLRGNTASCAARPARSQLKPLACFPEQEQCQRECFLHENECASDQCTALKASKTKYASCLAGCAAPACYSACPVCN